MPVVRVLLAGAGRTNLDVLRRLARRPDVSLEVTLVSPDSLACHSAMLPGLIAGHYAVEDSHVVLPPLVQWARARFVSDSIVTIDLYTRIATLASGEFVPFDVLVLDIGSLPDTAIPGARAHALAAKPLREFFAAWETLKNDAAAGNIATIAIVGAGPAAVELLLAMHHRLAQIADAMPRFTLVTDRHELMPYQPLEVRRRIGRALVARDVVIHLDSAPMAVEPASIITGDRRRIAADRIVFATTLTGAPFVAASGLATDAGGLVRVNDHLQSISHPFVFAVGGCATYESNPRASAGPYSGREARPLYANLRRHARGAKLMRYRSPRGGLMFITTGERSAIASRPPLVAEGDWVWRWKDEIDRRFIRRLTPPA
jgi:selenide,water dikinase